MGIMPTLELDREGFQTGEIVPLMTVTIRGAQREISVVRWEKRNESGGIERWRYATGLDMQLSRQNDRGRLETLFPNDFDAKGYQAPISVGLKDGRTTLVSRCPDGSICARDRQMQEMASTKNSLQALDYMSGAITCIVVFDPWGIDTLEIVNGS
jgi:hypothetical protein